MPIENVKKERLSSFILKRLREIWMLIKLDLPQLLVVCAAFFTLSSLSYFYASNVMKKQVDLYSRSEMQVHHSAIRGLLNAHEAALQHAAVAVTYSVERGAGPEEIQVLLKTLAKLYSEEKDMQGIFGSVYGFIKGNYLDGTSWIPGEFFYPKTAPWLRGAVLTEGLFHSKPYLDPRTGDAVAAVSMVVYDNKGESIGVLAIDYFLNPIIEQVRTYRVADSGYGILLDDSYNILTCPDPNYVGKSLADFPGFEKVFEDLTKEANVKASPVLDYGTPKVLVDNVVLQKENNIVFFSPLENGWYIGIVVPNRYYYSEVYRMLPVIVLISILLAFIVCVILIRMSKAKMRSEEESHAKSSFLARMSHEIRTPMNAILGMCELARRNIGKPEALGYLTEIRHAGADLLSIINDILDYSKITTGVIHLKEEAYNTCNLFYDTYAIVKVRMGAKDIDLSFEIDPKTPAKLNGDEVRVRQVILNLLTNAVKYTPQGYVKCNINYLRTGNKLISLTIRVEDSGIGIKKEDLGSLFQDFVRIDQGGIRHIEGTGLGLSITRSLCIAMNGGIAVESDFGKGTVFTATLEQTVEDWTPIGVIDPMDKKLISEVVKEEDEVYAPFAVPGLKALVVDDIETNLVVTKGLLGPYGFDVTVCDRGAKAIELTKEKKYDLVFIDHMMPEMDGTETMKRIREFSPHYRKVPIIALTAAVMAGMKEMFLSKGFDDFLGKPIELKNLNTILERWIPKELRTTPIKREEPEIKDKEDLGISIEGVDVDKGLRYIGGEKSNYIKALSVFCKDIDKRLDLFRNIAKENISNFQVQVHAIKSASANIGAINLSKEAQLLEDAAINGDLYTIRSRYSSFHKLLSKTTDLIKDALVKESIESEVTDFKSGGKINVERDILITLKEAIDSRDIGTIDRILDNLSSRPNDLETRETIERISNHVLLADYDEAGLLVMIHLTREKTAS